METITMSTSEQRRAWILNRLGKGDLRTREAADLLGLSERQVWRLRTAFDAHRPAGLVHGNRGRASPRRIEPQGAEPVVALAHGRYARRTQGHPGRGLPRPARHLRTSDRADPRPAAGRRSRSVAQPGRAGAGRARDRIDPGRVTPGEGPDRAAVGDVAGPARHRA